MDSRIGHLHCRYRFIGNRDAVAAVTARLDRLARQDLPQTLTEALDQALGDDPTVYIIRQVNSRLFVNLAEEPTDTELAGRWAEQLAGAVMRNIAAENGANVVRFTDQAEYAARFLSDLLRGNAWECWFYGPFAARRANNLADTVRAVLFEQRARLPAVLGYLHRAGTLEPVIAHLDTAALVELWSQCPGARSRPESAMFRPLFAAAWRLVEQLDLWSSSPPDSETLFRNYLASNPPSVDWRDRRALAMAVLDGLRFLNGRGYLRRWEEALTPARLDPLLAELDWLDGQWLQAAVLELLVQQPRVAVDSDLPIRPPDSSPTPRQHALLEDLAAALQGNLPELERGQPLSPANALRLYALLVAHAPRWADDPLATGLIQRLLEGWASLARQDRVTDTRLWPATLGKPALEVMAKLAGTKAGKEGTAIRIETRCAGVFLLLRAVLDLRLPEWVDTLKYPGPGFPNRLGRVLATLGLCWGGEAGNQGDQIDAGLQLLAQSEEPLTVQMLRDTWSAATVADHARLQTALLQVLAGQRVLRGTVLHLYQLTDDEGGPALVAGDATAVLWPLGACPATLTEILETVDRWLQEWEQATGYRPVLVIDETLAALRGRLAGADVVIASPVAELKPTPDDAVEQLAEHCTGRRALVAALRVLAAGRLDLPAADLCLALMATVLLRVWARWLRQFATSSVPYLLDHCIRRPGRITLDAHHIVVEMDSRPLDIVIEMAGYTAALEPVSWLGQRRVSFLR